MRARRVVIGIAAVGAAWLILLVVLGVVLAGRQEEQARERMGDSLQANVAVERLGLDLVLGEMAIDGLAIRRADPGGHLAIDIKEVRCELAPLGWALVDRDCRELRVRGTRLEVSAATLFKLKRPPKRKPFRAHQVVIEDATFVFLPSAFTANLGRIEVTIHRAVAGDTVMRSPLSPLLALRALDAHVTVPAGGRIQLRFEAGTLTASGALLGTTPVAIPIDLPVKATANNAHEEMQLLVKVGKDAAERLVAKRAGDWLKNQLLR